MQECCRNCAILENLFVLEKLVLKFKHNPNVSKTNFVSWTGTQHLKNFSKLSLMKKKRYVPEKKSKTLRHKRWIDTTVKNLAAKSKNFIKDKCNKNDNKKRFNRIRNLRKKTVVEKRKNFSQTFLVMNVKVINKIFLILSKC